MFCAKSQNPTTMHTLYFSKRCRFCQGFMEELAKSPFAKEVRLQCVDPSPSRPALPAWLKVVPTLIMGNGDDPKIGPTAVNNWLFERRLMQGQSGAPPAPAAAKSGASRESITVPTYSPDVNMRPSPAAPPPGSNTGGSLASGSASASAPKDVGAVGEIAAWHDAEMAGNHWSDTYSFVQDAYGGEESKKVVNPIVRNFELLNGSPISLSAAATANSSSSSAPKQSEKSARLMREFEAFSKSRDTEFAPTRRIG
jgi:hypothetical protein